ncbi:hypothetical protein BH09ACT12_BH09ACT12_13540 [soil metagenome]
MELVVYPRRDRRRPVLLAIAGVLSGWVVMLLLVPAMLGLDTVVLDEPKGDLAEGTLVVTRAVPSSDLSRGDVLTTGGGVLRVSSTSPGLLLVDDAERLTTSDTPTLDRAVLILPVAGLPLAGAEGLLRWLLAAGAAILFALAATSRRVMRRVRLAG